MWRAVQYNGWEMLIQLSHHLSEQTPFYSSLPKPELKQIYELGKGDVCNSFYFTTSNHAGTHVDAPRHFCSEGRRITDYELAELVFSRPAVLDVPLRDEDLVDPRHLEAAATAASDDTDLVLLRSGFGKFRGDERRCSTCRCGMKTWLIHDISRLQRLRLRTIRISSFCGAGLESSAVMSGGMWTGRRGSLLRLRSF